jgi:cbb3-type cytochrome oxidase subunit 1
MLMPKTADQVRAICYEEKIRMKASSLSFQAAVLLVLVGMLWGIVMAISQDHSAMPAHAHLNLLGWVSLFLFGIFYHLHPAVDSSRVALMQVCIWIAATLVLSAGVALVHSGHSIGEPIAGVGSVVIFVDMILFGWLVRGTMHASRLIQPSIMPAE